MPGKPIDDPLQDKIPQRLATPVAYVRAGKLSTIRLMHDPLDTNSGRWFETTPDKKPRDKQPVPPVRPGNEVMYLVDGRTAFREMAAAIKSAQDKEHFVYLLNWIIDDLFEMIPGDPNSTVKKLLEAASKNGVEVRAMFWDQLAHFIARTPKLALLLPLPTPYSVELRLALLALGIWLPRFFLDNSNAAKRINGLSNGRAILDEFCFLAGSHHQKILIVYGSEGLVAFCGGIDFNKNRIHPAKEPGSPLHDVHCRIRGPAASSLLLVFRQRWEDHPEGGLLASKTWPTPGPKGKQFVQIGRTYPNTFEPIYTFHKYYGTNKFAYSFARFGEQSARRMALKAIREARHFIYIEDQYLVNMEVSAALCNALQRGIKHLTILIPHWSISDLPQVRYRRQQFIAPLRKAGGARVGVYYLAPPGSPGTSVHSKLYIVDDKFAIIGSMNCNRRGFTHDSEVMAGIFDESDSENHPTWHFAHRLRVRLWAKHLWMEHYELADGVASVVHWRSPQSHPVDGPYIAPYDENENIETIYPAEETLWNKVFDPDGSEPYLL